MGKRVIISGVDGFLGGKIVRCILDRTDFDVLGLTASPDLPVKMLEREKIKKSDRICFMENRVFLGTDNVPEDIYGVVHLAFSRRMQPAGNIASSLDFAADFFRKLAEWNADRVINMSSQGIYGNTPEIRTEDTAPAPETPYTMAKYASEVLFRTVLADVPHHTSLRLDPVVQSQNVIRGLCRSAKEGEIHLRGGSQVFSFIDAEDVGEAVVRMLRCEGGWDAVYNVGWTNTRYTLTELAEMMAEAAGRNGFKRPGIILEKNDTVIWAGMDAGRFMRKTGWRPSIDLRQSIDGLFRE